MVLNGAGVRGVPGGAGSPDKVLRSPSRWLFVAAALFVVAVGALFAVGGAFAPLEAGEDRQWFPVAFGVQLAGLGAAVAVAVWPSRPRRRPLPAPQPVADGVALPLRRAPRIAGIAGLLVAATIGVTVAVVADGAGMAALGVVVVAACVGLAAVLVRAASRGAGTIVLNPTAVTLPAGTTPRTTIEWTDLSEVTVTGGWQPHLVATYKGPGLASSRLAAQAWPPSALVTVLDYYRTHQEARAALTAPEALTRFQN